MLAAFEQICKEHEKTIAFVGAFGTLAAVFVSLLVAWFARRMNQTRVRARVQRAIIPHSALTHTPIYVSVSVTNIGMLPLRIPLSFVQVKVPFRKRNWVVRVLEDLNTDLLISAKKFPVEIIPRVTETFYIREINVFRYIFHNTVIETGWFTRFLFRFVKVTVVTDDGMRFTAIVDKDIRKEIEESRKKAPTTIIKSAASPSPPDPFAL